MLLSIKQTKIMNVIQQSLASGDFRTILLASATVMGIAGIGGSAMIKSKIPFIDSIPKPVGTEYIGPIDYQILGISAALFGLAYLMRPKSLF